MSQIPLYALRFGPIYEYRLWGGRHFANLLSAPLPGEGPIGEAWLFSDRDNHMSHVANGPLRGRTLGELPQQFPEQLLRNLAHRFPRFPKQQMQDKLTEHKHHIDKHGRDMPAMRNWKWRQDAT